MKTCKVDLETVYESHKEALTLANHDDPVKFVHRYKAKEDREIAGFLAAQFAYGRIQNFTMFLENVFSRIAGRPSAFIHKGDFQLLKGCYYRFQKDDDIIMLFEALRRIYTKFGGLGKMLEDLYGGDIRESIWNLRELLSLDDERLTFFFPKRLAPSALKRWHLYLRWMVRKDTLDAGLWKFISTKDLVVPLDTHMFKIGKCMGWTKRVSPSYNAAQEITNALTTYSKDDPLKYDFFLCHKIGIEGKCSGVRNNVCKGKCLIYEV